MSVTVFGVFAAFSLKTGGGELNWPVTAYLSGGVLAAWWLVTQFDSPRDQYRRGTALAVGCWCVLGLLLTVAAHRSDLIHPALQAFAGPPAADRPYPVRQFDPTCRLR